MFYGEYKLTVVAAEEVQMMEHTFGNGTHEVVQG